MDGIEIGRFRLPQAKKAQSQSEASPQSNPLQVAVIVIFVVSGLCLDSISECLQYKAVEPAQNASLTVKGLF